jgi:hypothetical protein
MITKLLRRIYKEKIAIDAERISVLRGAVGEQRTREIVEEVVFHMMERIDLLDRAIDAGDAVEACALAKRMAAMSEELGLVDVTRVAGDLNLCVGRGDRTAAAAVSARLGRLSDSSIVHLINYADRTAL